MPDVDIATALADAEKALDHGRDLKGTGFWKAVAAVKRDPSLVDHFADRIGRIDRRHFEQRVRLRVPAPVGLLLLAGATAAGVVLLGVSSPVGFLVGTGLIIVGTHSPAHWLVGKLFGMRFTHVFLGGPKPPRPGMKIDYGTYLRATPKQRAVMHASGAVVTKAVPFALVAFSRWPLITWLLLAVGVAQIATDVALSTKVSDWMKVKRELRASRL